MDRVQELIDERRAELPTGLAKELLDLCKQANDESDRLYRVTCVRIVGTGFADNEVALKPITQHLMLKVKKRPGINGVSFTTEQEWLDMGFFEQEWLDQKLPYTLEQFDTCMTIVCDIKRYVTKRTRDEFEFTATPQD
jgi:hypothetical protein